VPSFSDILGKFGRKGEVFIRFQGGKDLARAREFPEDRNGRATKRGLPTIG